MIDRKCLNQGMSPNKPAQTLNLKLIIGQDKIRQKFECNILCDVLELVAGQFVVVDVDAFYVGVALDVSVY